MEVATWKFYNINNIANGDMESMCRERASSENHSGAETPQVPTETQETEAGSELRSRILAMQRGWTILDMGES